MKILAFADLHLGASADHRQDSLADQEAILEQILDVARDRNVDLIVNAGDTFDRPRPPVPAVHVWQRFNRKLADAGLPMVSILGNTHDVASSFEETAVELFDAPLSRVSRHPELIEVAGVTVATLPSVPLVRLGAALEGVGRDELFVRAADLLLETAAELRERAPSGKPCVLVLHWAVSGASLPTGLPVAELAEPILDLHALEQLGFDSIIVGHIHRPQILGGDTMNFYCGSPLTLNFGEAVTEHGCYVVEFSPDVFQGAEYEFVPLTDRRFVTVDVDLTEVSERDGLRDAEAPKHDASRAANGVDPGSLSLTFEDSSVKGAVSHTQEEGPRSPTPGQVRLTTEAPGMRAPTPESNHERSGEGAEHGRAAFGATNEPDALSAHGLLDTTDLIAAAIAEQFPLDDAVVRVRYTATEEQHRRIDTAALRKLCLDAGAHRVFQIEPTIVRSQRVRIDGFDRSLDEHSALDTWAAANKVDAQPLHDILSISREKSASTVTTGATFDPLRLTGRNIGRFPELDVTLQDGATVLLGGNGSGKSSILKALELALYAEDAGALREIISPWADGLELAMEFTLDGELHRVRRTLRGVTRSESGLASGGKATLDLEWRASDGEWCALTRESAKETQRLLCQLLGMSRTLFRASCFLAQGDGPAFLKAEPKDRKAMAAELLDPAGLWAADARYAATLAKDTTAELATVASQLLDREERLIGTEDLAETVASLETGETICRGEVGKAETALEAATAAVAANQVAAERKRAAFAARDSAGDVLVSAEHALRSCREQADKILPAREQIDRLNDKADRIPELEQADRGYQEAVAALEDAKRRRQNAESATETARAAYIAAGDAADTMAARYDDLVSRVTHLRASSDTECCQLCEQTLGIEARDASIVNLDAQIAPMVQKIQEATRLLDERLAEYETKEREWMAIQIPNPPSTAFSPGELAEARQAAMSASVLKGSMEGLEREAERLPSLEQAVRDARQAVVVAEANLFSASEGVGDEAALTRAVQDAREQVSHHRGRLETVTAELARAKQRQEQAAQLRGELAALRGRQQLLQHHLDIYRTAERAFGRDGIPVLLLETVLDQIDTDANNVLRRFPTDDGWTFQVRFETQREQATTDRVKEELYVMVEAPDYPQDFRSLSGGEESRVAFGVRVALAMLLGRLRGAESRLLVLDELSFLDEAGETRLVELINELATGGTFSKILTVSHSPNVRDAFEQTIEIEKRDGRSEIIPVRVLEGMLA